MKLKNYTDINHGKSYNHTPRSCYIIARKDDKWYILTVWEKGIVENRIPITHCPYCGEKLEVSS